MQDMVPRAELLSAVSEVEALRVGSQTKVSALEAEISLERAHLARAESEAAALRSSQANMVQKAELLDAVAQCEALRGKAAATDHEYARALEEQGKRVACLEAEKTGLLLMMQVLAGVDVITSFVFRVLYDVVLKIEILQGMTPRADLLKARLDSDLFDKTVKS